jgi:hypothetical protein
MTAEPTIVEILTQRFELVRALSQVNARHLLHRQAGGGAEIEALGCSEEIRRHGPSPERLVALEDAEARVEREREAVDACDAEIAGLEERLEELDRRIGESGST